MAGVREFLFSRQIHKMPAKHRKKKKKRNLERKIEEADETSEKEYRKMTTKRRPGCPVILDTGCLTGTVGISLHSF